MSARMYNNDSYRIIPTTIHPGSSIGTNIQDSGDDLNYIISGMIFRSSTAWRIQI